VLTAHIDEHALLLPEAPCSKYAEALLAGTRQARLQRRSVSLPWDASLLLEVLEGPTHSLQPPCLHACAPPCLSRHPSSATANCFVAAPVHMIASADLGSKDRRLGWLYVLGVLLVLT
jgi:hypothetical protein